MDLAQRRAADAGRGDDLEVADPAAVRVDRDCRDRVGGQPFPRNVETPAGEQDRTVRAHFTGIRRDRGVDVADAIRAEDVGDARGHALPHRVGRLAEITRVRQFEDSRQVAGLAGGIAAWPAALAPRAR